MTQQRLGGIGRRNQEAVDFAKANGINVNFTNKGHVMFRGPGGVVVASGSPRSPNNVKRVIGQLRKISRKT